MEYTITARPDPGGVAYYVYSTTQGCIVSDPLHSKQDAYRLMNELNVGASIARMRAKGFEAIKEFFRQHRVSPKHRKKYDYHVAVGGGLEIRAKDGERWRVTESEGEFVFLAMMPGVDTETLQPCPFCGNQPTIEPWHGGGPQKMRIGCENDDCHVAPSTTGENREEAYKRWNMRARYPATA